MGPNQFIATKWLLSIHECVGEDGQLLGDLIVDTYFVCLAARRCSQGSTGLGSLQSPRRGSLASLWACL